MKSRAIALTVLSLVFAAGAQAADAQPQFAPMAPPLPFPPAVLVNDVLYLSGQIGNGPGNKLPEGIEAQGRQAMENVSAVLKGQGASLGDVFKCTVMLADMKQWAAFNAVYVSFFDPKRLPVRSAFGVNGLVSGALVQVECWAFAPRR